ncbi:MAG TPA: hypothetical protein VIK72_10785 [Clostridiaceae bacterium]
MNTWKASLIRSLIISSLLFLLGLIMMIFLKPNADMNYTVETYMCKIDIAFGAIMGFEFLLRERYSLGKWSFNIPKFLLMGLPGIFFCYYIAVVKKAVFFFQDVMNAYIPNLPPIIFMSHFKLFNMMIYVLTGYMVVTCFSKQLTKGESLKLKRWISYGIIAIVAFGAFAHFWGLNREIQQLYSISSIFLTLMILLFDVAFGFLLGLEYYIIKLKADKGYKFNIFDFFKGKEYHIPKFRTGNRIKFDLPRLVSMSFPAMIIGLMIIYYGLFVLPLPKEFYTDFYNIQYKIYGNRDGVYLTFLINYIEMFQIFFGLTFATSFLKKKKSETYL